MSSNQNQNAPIKILSLVEATSINAVAKNVLEFYRSAQELSTAPNDLPKVEASIATFARTPDVAQPANEFVTAAQLLGLDVEIIPERRRFDLSVLPALRNLVERKRPDIVVTHSVKSHFLLWRSGLWRQCPWVAFHHGYTTTDLKMRLYNQLDKWSLPVADRLVTVCTAFARELADKTGVAVDTIAVQHNSIRPRPLTIRTAAESFRSRQGFVGDDLVILAVGRLSQEKAHCDLLEAFRELLVNNADLKYELLIVGDGPERTRLEAQAASSGIAGHVTFTGQQSDIQSFYAIADVFVLPSHSEGSPNVLLEAMAANVPIVATAVGGVPEIVQDNETALLVPANAPQQMAKTIARLLTDDVLAQRLVKNSSAAVATRHTPAHYVQSLVRIYQRAIEGRRSNQSN